ncbi:MAG: hypothetical protein JOY99_08795 [Sphingomonadaceae bacterium]|nr:hypothetical protein [Sphingomonadaceae bacterium]
MNRSCLILLLVAALDGCDNAPGRYEGETNSDAAIMSANADLNAAAMQEAGNSGADAQQSRLEAHVVQLEKEVDLLQAQASSLRGRNDAPSVTGHATANLPPPPPSPKATAIPVIAPPPPPPRSAKAAVAAPTLPALEPVAEPVPAQRSALALHAHRKPTTSGAKPQEELAPDGVLIHRAATPAAPTLEISPP